MTPDKPLRVIRTELGPGTGDVTYIDENGDRWIKRYSTPMAGTGDRVAILEDGSIKE